MATVYAIPGFGCTEILFMNIKTGEHTLRVLRWPVPEKNISLEEYARRFLDQIDTSQKFSLLGVSFGGMLCAELAEILKPERVILVSSAKNRDELPWPVRLLKYFPIYKFFSEKALRWLGSHSLWVLGVPSSFRPEMKFMIEQMPGNYFAFCIGYISNWKRRRNATGIIHIHGDADRLLWYNCVKNPDHTVPGGSHAMVVFKADEVNAALAKIL
jgi:pimeloyl-ACP methyl ester carboxylesterase